MAKLRNALINVFAGSGVTLLVVYLISFVNITNPPRALGFQWGHIISIEIKEGKVRNKVYVRMTTSDGNVGTIVMDQPATGFAVGDTVCVSARTSWIGKGLTLMSAPAFNCERRDSAKAEPTTGG
jgi:hypothetical protein